MNSSRTPPASFATPVFLWLLLLLPSSAVRAQPELVNYQGRLSDAAGVRVNGNLRLEFNIFDDAIAGNRLWGPYVLEGVRVVDGRFNVILGPRDSSNRGLRESFTSGSERFLEIKVGTDSPIAPRQQFLSVPYAFFAHNLPDVINKERLEIVSPSEVTRLELASAGENEGKGTRELVFARSPTRRFTDGSRTDGMKLAYDAAADRLEVSTLKPGEDDPGTIPDESHSTVPSGPHLTITRDGKVGIRTAQPQRALDVAGDLGVSGELKVDGGLRLAALRLSGPYKAAKGSHFAPAGEFVPSQTTMTSVETSFCFLTDVLVQGQDSDGEISRCSITTVDGKWALNASANDSDVWAYCEARCFEYRK